VIDLDQLEARLQRHTRHLGGHYTPAPIVRRAVAAALAPLARGRGPEAILRLRVVDPAVGSGRFLLAALDTLADATGQPQRFRAAIAAACLYGADVHPPAAALARRALAEAAGIPPSALRGHVEAADSLLDDLGATLGLASFDAVLANPPWLSYSGRQAAALAPERRRRLASRFAAFRRWPTSHGAFLELAARLLAPGGRGALIVPLQVCHLPGYEATRRAVAERCRFEPPPEPLGEHAFPGVVQPAAIVHLHRPAAPSRARPVAAAPPSRPCGAAPRRDIEAAILARALRHPTAPPHTFGDPGVHSGNSARLILRDEPAAGLAPVREGRCLHPFALAPARAWLVLEPRLPDHHYCTIRPPATYSGAPLLLRQTADRPVAARHVEPTYFRNSLLACAGIPGMAPAALLGLLNSTLLAFVHQRLHADSRQRAFPQVKVAHLQALPLARDVHGLEPVARRLEAMAAERLRSQGALAASLASALSCRVADLAGRRGPLALPLASDDRLLRHLARRLPHARPALDTPAVRRAIRRAAERARHAIARLDPPWRRDLQRLDQLVCHAYGLTPAQARYVHEHTPAPPTRRP